MSTGELWQRMLGGDPQHPIPTDLGTSTVTGVRAPGAPEWARTVRHVGNPVLRTVPLDAARTRALGSGFARTGLLYEPPEMRDETYTDPFGVEWLWVDGAGAPLNHPLQDADYLAVARHPRPTWPDTIQATVGGPERDAVIADAPAPGLLETCFGLRNSWQFMMDITDNWRVANALLDWALDTVGAAYEHMLTALPVAPDVVLYGDDYGYQGGMFLSDEDFRIFVRPRLRTLFSRIRRLTPAAICFHCCGAVGPILGDLADLGVELLNLQSDARGMELARVRAALPRTITLHGYTDLTALGAAVAVHDRRAMAVLTDELVRSAPAVAAPVDCLDSGRELADAALGAHFVRALTSDDVQQLGSVGPVGAVLDRAAESARGRPRACPSDRAPNLAVRRDATAR